MRGFQPFHALALFSLTRIAALTTSSVLCSAELWTINREGQTPCQVAAALQGACFNDVWNIDPLPLNQKYGGPLLNQSSKCQCNTVAFSLVAACGACQGREFSTWTQWIENCTSSDITIAGYPLMIPLGINVPAWAYLNIAPGKLWDRAAALAMAESFAAERTGGSPPAAGILSSWRNSSSRTWPIAGGIAGGVLFLALLGLVGFFLYCRKHSYGRKSDEPIEIAHLINTTTHDAGEDPPPVYVAFDPSTPPTMPLSKSRDNISGGPSYSSFQPFIGPSPDLK